MARNKRKKQSPTATRQKQRTTANRKKPAKSTTCKSKPKKHTLDSVRADVRKLRRNAKRGSSSITTRSAARKNSAYAVFYTTEILELILLNLPMRDLLLSQRVTPKWRNVIKANKKLQQTLFFEPADSSTVWRLTQTRDSLYRYKTVTRQLTGTTNDPSIYEGVLFNPLLLSPCAAGHEIMLLLRAQANTAFVQLKFDMWRTFPDRDPNETVVEESWRRMLLTQPPRPDLLSLLTSLDRDNPVGPEDARYTLPAIPRGHHVADSMEVGFRRYPEFNWENVVITSPYVLLTEEHAGMTRITERESINSKDTHIFMVKIV